MAKSTGPILAVGGITFANRTILNGKPVDWRIILGTGVAAGMFALLEKGWERGAVALSWLALITVLFVKVDRTVPAPAESLNKWIQKGTL